MGATNPESLSSSPTFRTYAEAGALSQIADLGAAFGGCCRLITVGHAGNLDITDGTGHRGIIYAVQLGQGVLVQAMKIHPEGTTAQKITAYA